MSESKDHVVRVRPLLRAGNFTVFDNLFIDAVMPELRPNAWRVFCFLMRQTRGWQRISAAPTYQEIMAGTGIGSDKTVTAALEELIAFGLVVKKEGRGAEPNNYILNDRFEVVMEREEGDRYRVRSFGTERTFDVTLVLRHAPDQYAGEGTLRGLKRALSAELQETKNTVAVVRNACRLLYGERVLPSYKEIGGFIKHVGGAERALNLLWRYVHVEIEEHPLRYVKAAEARRRRALEEGREPEREALPAAPQHLDVYTYAERFRFVRAGHDPDKFKGAGRADDGDPLYRYVDPDQ